MATVKAGWKMTESGDDIICCGRKMKPTALLAESPRQLFLSCLECGEAVDVEWPFEPPLCTGDLATISDFEQLGIFVV